MVLSGVITGQFAHLSSAIVSVCLRPHVPGRRTRSTLCRHHSFLFFLCRLARSLPPRIAGWLISGVAKGHQCPPSASVRVPPSLVSALIEDLSSPPSAGHTCYVRPDPLSAGPLPSTSQSRKKRVARPFTQPSIVVLSLVSFLPPQMAISKLVTALGSPWLVSASAQSFPPSPISIPSLFCRSPPAL